MSNKKPPLMKNENTRRGKGVNKPLSIHLLIGYAITQYSLFYFQIYN
jgi:hypothetical protein